MIVCECMAVIKESRTHTLKIRAATLNRVTEQLHSELQGLTYPIPTPKVSQWGQLFHNHELVMGRCCEGGSFIVVSAKGQHQCIEELFQPDISFIHSKISGATAISFTS